MTPKLKNGRGDPSYLPASTKDLAVQQSTRTGASTRAPSREICCDLPVIPGHGKWSDDCNFRGCPIGLSQQGEPKFSRWAGKMGKKNVLNWNCSHLQRVLRRGRNE